MTIITEQAAAIVRGDLVVLYADECHLSHGDARGYVWGPSDQRMEVPIANARERQTYFGAVDARTGELTVMEALQGDGDWTVRFLTFLREQYASKQLLICWDGASYHRGNAVRSYLASQNHGTADTAWPLTCFQFAPHAPEQNPIEDVWLKAKTFIRRSWPRLDGSFQTTKDLFEEAVMTMTVDFPKLRTYLTGLEIT